MTVANTGLHICHICYGGRPSLSCFHPPPCQCKKEWYPSQQKVKITTVHQLFNRRAVSMTNCYQQSIEIPSSTSNSFEFSQEDSWHMACRFTSTPSAAFALRSFFKTLNQRFSMISPPWASYEAQQHSHCLVPSFLQSHAGPVLCKHLAQAGRKNAGHGSLGCLGHDIHLFIHGAPSMSTFSWSRIGKNSGGKHPYGDECIYPPLLVVPKH